MNHSTRTDSASPQGASRTATLQRHNLSEGARDERLEGLLELAIALTGVEAAALHLRDGEHYYPVAAIGGAPEQLPAPGSPAWHPLPQTELLAVADISADPAWAGSAPQRRGFRFLAAIGLRGHDGSAIGILCLLDRQPRTADQRLAGKLRQLAGQACDLLELRRLKARSAPTPGAPPDTLNHQLLDSIGEGLCAMDRSGTITLCNDAFVKLLGLPDKSSVLGQPLNAITNPARLDGGCSCGSTCPIIRAAQQGQPARAACEIFRRPDGSQLPVEYRIAPIRSNGVLEGAICTFADISERARDEAQRAFLLELSDRLQHSVDRLDLPSILDGRLGQLLSLERIAYGHVDGAGDALVLSHQWQADGLTAAPERLPLDGRSGLIARQLRQGILIPLAGQKTLSEHLGCPAVVAVGLSPDEDGLLLFGSRSPRAWSNQDLAMIHDIAARLRAATERTLGIRALREAEQRVSLANEIASIGVGEYDPSSGQLHWDAKLKQLAQLEPDEPTPTVSELLLRVHPDDRVRVAEAFQAALEAGRNGEISLEYRILARDGSHYLWLTNRGRHIIDHRGRPRILGTTREITAERNAADELRRINTLLEEQIEERRQAERRQAAYIELGDLLRSQPDTTSIDALAVRILGQALGVRLVQLSSLASNGETACVRHAWPPTPNACGSHYSLAPYRELGRTLAQGETVAVEDVGRDPRTASCVAALEEKGLQSLVCVPRIERGRLTAILCLLHDKPYRWLEDDISFIRDIADRAWTADKRLRAERALFESEAQFRTLADNMSQLAWMAAPDGAIYWYNKRWYDYTGSDPEAMYRRGIGAVQHPLHRHRVSASMRRAFTHGEVWEDTHPLRGRDGNYRWFLSRALPIRDDQGRVVQWFGTHTDVTAQVSAEDALRELNDSLERRVVERTQLLAEANQRLQVEMQERERAEETLRHAQKMDAIGQLTGGLAHDFNNMLTGVLGALDLLQRRLDPGRDDLAHYIDAATGSANRAAALTHRLLAFARRQSLDPQAVNVDRLVDSMEDMLRRTIGEHIQLSTDLLVPDWPAYTDAHQLENALLNLVINARDAMPDGGRLDISTRRHERSTAADELGAGDYIELTVRDSGCGMPPEVIAKAFDPFFTTKPIGQGTGLGLSMVYGFVRQCGGQVRIDSRVGSGTAITVLLPRDRQPPRVAEPEAVIGEAPRARSGETVLVVEDEVAVRMLVIEVLRELGYTALEAVDADSALATLARPGHIDLLVTDVGLPGTNGRQLAEMARQARPGLKVLFITGYAPNAEVRDKFLDDGMDMLAKPFNIDLLAVRIRRMIGDAKR